MELELLSEHGLRARIVHRPFAPEATQWLAVELGDSGLARQGGARGEGPSPETARAALLQDLPEHDGAAPHAQPRPKVRRVKWDHVDLGQRPDAVIARELRVPTHNVTVARNRRGIAPCPRNRRPWLTDEVRAKLGTAHDHAVAEELGLHPHQIMRARNELGIPPAPRAPLGRPWLTSAVRARLGTVPDKELAAEVGVSAQTVAVARRELGRPAVRSIPWLTEEVRARLGRESDTRIANDLGLHPQTVTRRRRRLGIPTAPSKGARFPHGLDDWLTPRLREQLGELPDREIAKRAGVSMTTVADARRSLGIAAQASKRRQWCTPDVEARLGTVPDADLAAELGLAKSTVASARRKRDVPALRAPKPPRRPWLTNHLRERLGRVPDVELAREAGVATVTVGRARAELGIPRHRRGQARPSEPETSDELAVRLVDRLAAAGPMDLERLATEIGAQRERTAEIVQLLAEDGFVAVDDDGMWDLT